MSDLASGYTPRSGGEVNGHQKAVRLECPRPGMRRSAGGVVVHPDGEVPATAAVREVREELGVEAEVFAEIPGGYMDSTTANKHFVLRWVKDVGTHDDETAETRWVSWDEAPALMRKGRKAISVARDSEVLEEARKLWALKVPTTAQ